MAWLPSDFKKQGREMRSTELAEAYGLYRQLYCGCEYSLRAERNAHAQNSSKAGFHTLLGRMAGSKNGLRKGGAPVCAFLRSLHVPDIKKCEVSPRMNKQNHSKLLKLAASAVIAAAYAALTIVLAPISYGPIQFRVSEALTVLPFLMPGTVWGIAVGCVLANLYTGSVLDIVFGSLATLLAALLTAWFGKRGNTVKNRMLGCLMPVVFNAVIVGAVLTWGYELPGVCLSPQVLRLQRPDRRRRRSGRAVSDRLHAAAPAAEDQVSASFSIKSTIRKSPLLRGERSFA